MPHITVLAHRGAELPLPLVSIPRSDLLRRVLGCLRDHPHEDTVYGVTLRLGVVSADAVEAALTALGDESLVTRAGDHWQLTRSGWAAAHADDPR